jgi:hypothetical protein
MIFFLLPTSLSQRLIKRNSHMAQLAVQFGEFAAQAGHIAAGRQIHQVPQPARAPLDLALPARPSTGGEAQSRQEDIAAHGVLQAGGDDLLTLVEQPPEQWLVRHCRRYTPNPGVLTGRPSSVALQPRRGF